jgi:phosphatidylserine/phosphatidylglycerophosphate/cardiolipin synthase-like enzyme
VIDSKTVVLGSHNWTNQGVEANRDASLLIRHAGIARYYEKVFLHDWDHLAKSKLSEHTTPIPVIGGNEAAALGLDDETRYVRVPWSEWAEE